MYGFVPDGSFLPKLRRPSGDPSTTTKNSKERITTIIVLLSVPAGYDFERQLAAAELDSLWAMVTSFAEKLMSAEADAIFAQSGVSRTRRRSTRAAASAPARRTHVISMGLAVTKLRSGAYFLDWLLERRCHVEQALMSVVATDLPA